MDSYITLGEAQAYFDLRLFTVGWDSAQVPDRTKALAHATKLIDRLAYNGVKTDDDQVNEFPRDGATDVPESIKQATAEIALALLEGIDPERLMDEVSITSQGFSSVRSTYNRDFAQEHKMAGIPSAAAWALLKPFLRDPNTVKMNRGS